jgi:hypothetical protein
MMSAAQASVRARARCWGRPAAQTGQLQRVEERRVCQRRVSVASCWPRQRCQHATDIPRACFLACASALSSVRVAAAHVPVVQTRRARLLRWPTHTSSIVSHHHPSLRACACASRLRDAPGCCIAAAACTPTNRRPARDEEDPDESCQLCQFASLRCLQRIAAPMRPDQRLPQACVVAVGLLFGVLLAGLSTHLHARELAALRGTSRRACCAGGGRLTGARAHARHTAPGAGLARGRGGRAVRASTPGDA